MRLPRFRLRTLLIATAIVGLVLALLSRSLVYRREALRHSFEWGRYRGYVHDPGLARTERERASRRAEHHWKLNAKYWAAAGQPWLPVPPDPPEPE